MGLQISRQVGQRVLIDGRIWMKVVRGGAQPKFEFDAPDDVDIIREELITRPGQTGLDKRHPEKNQLAERKAG